MDREIVALWLAQVIGILVVPIGLWLKIIPAQSWLDIFCCILLGLVASALAISIGKTILAR